MKKYYRIMAGSKSANLEQYLEQGFIGVNFGIPNDLSDQVSKTWPEFKDKYTPIWLDIHQEKGKVSAGLACGALWTFINTMVQNTIIICPNGNGKYHVGEIISEYYHFNDQIVPHRRKVRWFEQTIDRSLMSVNLKNSTGALHTICDISTHSDELESLIFGKQVVIEENSIEEQVNFALEKHLEDFLIQNWNQTDLGKNYNIFQEGDTYGKQFQTDTGFIDILAISKDKKEYLVVELKKNKASDAVVGQIQRYMGYIKDEFCDKDQSVKGVIIAYDDDIKIKRALSVANNIDFLKYEITFKLMKP